MQKYVIIFKMISKESGFYENTLGNLGRYLEGEGIETQLAQQAIQFFREFHQELTVVYGQTPDLVLASLPRRYIQHTRPFVLIQIMIDWKQEDPYARNVGTMLHEAFQPPLKDAFTVGLEYNRAKPFPLRTSLGTLKEFNPLGILRGTSV